MGKKIIILLAIISFIFVLILIPAKGYSEEVHQEPGIKSGIGPYGPTCACPRTTYNCGCIIL